MSITEQNIYDLKKQNVGREIRSIMFSHFGSYMRPLINNKYFYEHEIHAGSAGYMDRFYVVERNPEGQEVRRFNELNVAEIEWA